MDLINFDECVILCICLLALFINRHHVHSNTDISSCFKSTRSYKACELNNHLFIKTNNIYKNKTTEITFTPITSNVIKGYLQVFNRTD